MIINSLRLNNFSSYEGINEFDFTSTENDKNIVLIGGKNGAGKSSLFSAIKTCLYGPLAYGYIGINSHYVAKIKECINTKAFHKETVFSSVEMNITVPFEREEKQYTIKREWNYSKRKLTESFVVEVDEKVLTNKETQVFQNYLYSLMPPDLFDFFLLDGEVVGEVFQNGNYNTYIKNAVYTVCGLDMYETIRKYTSGYLGKASNDTEESLRSDYDALKLEIDKLKDNKKALEEENINVITSLEQVEVDLAELETAFKKAGGISQNKRKKLDKEADELVKLRAEANAQIKLFVEGIMPFIIVKDIGNSVYEQLEYENELAVSDYVNKKISEKRIKKSIGKAAGLENKIIDKIISILTKELIPTTDASSTPIHDLSRDEMNRVNGIISSVSNYNIDELVKLIKDKKSATERIAEISKILKEAMSDEDVSKYTNQENKLLKDKSELTEKSRKLTDDINALNQQIEEKTAELTKIKQIWEETVQNNNVSRLSSGIEKMMESLLAHKVEIVRDSIGNLAVEKVHKLYRKENLITHIEIDEDFFFNPYQNAQYTAAELSIFLKNVGIDDFAMEIGHKGIETLYSYYKVSSLQLLQKKIIADENITFDLYKRIDINRLSNGERQIFILALYWAIIEISGQDIPFVIDTPYARIDHTHRVEISELFFPNISKQVIILSTDEEIDEEYYPIIKPYISKEYLLINDKSQNRTTIETGYFFEGI